MWVKKADQGWGWVKVKKVSSEPCGLRRLLIKKLRLLYVCFIWTVWVKKLLFLEYCHVSWSGFIWTVWVKKKSTTSTNINASLVSSEPCGLRSCMSYEWRLALTHVSSEPCGLRRVEGLWALISWFFVSSEPCGLRSLQQAPLQRRHGGFIWTVWVKKAGSGREEGTSLRVSSEPCGLRRSYGYTISWNFDMFHLNRVG